MPALPAQARANSNQASSGSARADAQTRVEFIAVTQSDELLEQLGQSLDGESAIRHADTIEAARVLIEAAHPCVVMFDTREHGKPAEVIEQLQPANGLSVIVVFAPADQTAAVAQQIKRSATFAVLPVPLEIAKTAAVLEGAREEALARRNVVAQPGEPPPHSVRHVTTPVPADGAPRQPRPISPEIRPQRAIHSAPARSGPPRAVIAGGIAAVVIVALAAAWFVLRDDKGSADTSAEATSEPADAVPNMPAEIDAPSAQRAPAPMPSAPIAAPARQAVVPGAIDELLDKARIAFTERRYTDPDADSALLYYRSVLAQEPENGEALEGLTRIGGVLDARLQTALGQRNYDEASATLAQLKLIKPADPTLKVTEGKLAEARIATALESDDVDRAAALVRQASQSGALPAERTSRLRDDIERRQTDARTQRFAELVSTRVREGRLVEPASDSAKFHLAQLRKLSPDSRRTAAAERELQNAYLQRARDAGAAKQGAEMERWLAEARAAGVAPARIAAVQRDTRAAAVKATIAADTDRNVRLVQERINDGRLLDPPQDSALFHLNALRASNPEGAAAPAAALSAGLLVRGRSSLAAGRLDEADRYLGAARQLAVNLPEVDALAASLADARNPVAAGPVRVTADQLKRTRYVAPEYPRQALAKELSGNVKVSYTVGTDGRVRDAVITASNPPGVFDEVALAAVRRWRFKPYEVDGQAVEAISGTVMVFKPDDTQGR